MSEEGAAPAEPAEPAAPAADDVAAPVAPAEGGTPAQNPAEQAPAAPEGEPPKEVLTPEQVAKREGRRFGRKLDAAIRRAAEATARADLLERQLQESRPNQQARDGEPRLEDFSDINEFAKAKADYAIAQDRKETTAKQQKEAQTRELAALETAWEEKASRADGKYDDFDQVVGELKPTNPLVASIMEADNGEDIAYYLGKNPKEAARIAALPIRSQIREIGKLEAKLQAEPPKPKTPSKAPAPIKPLGGNASATTDVWDPNLPMAEFMKKRNAQVHRR